MERLHPHRPRLPQLPVHGRSLHHLLAPVPHRAWRIKANPGAPYHPPQRHHLRARSLLRPLSALPLHPPPHLRSPHSNRDLLPRRRPHLSRYPTHSHSLRNCHLPARRLLGADALRPRPRLRHPHARHAHPRPRPQSSRLARPTCRRLPAENHSRKPPLQPHPRPRRRPEHDPGHRHNAPRRSHRPLAQKSRIQERKKKRHPDRSGAEWRDPRIFPKPPRQLPRPNVSPACYSPESSA